MRNDLNEVFMNMSEPTWSLMNHIANEHYIAIDDNYRSLIY